MKKPARAHMNRRDALLTLMSSALLPACGGGTDLAGISSGGTGSFTSGPITGLGSVIVNGIRYDDSAAAIRFNGTTGTATDLQLGMVVRIQGSALTPATTPTGLATATADLIDCRSEWKGPVAGVDTNARTFLLLGQTVHVLATTLFTGGQFNGGIDGQFAEVYGFVDPNDGSLQASRIEISSDAPDRYQLSGVITGLTPTSFQLGSATIDFSAASGTSGLRNGLLVRVELQTSMNASGHWVALAVQTEDYRSELEDDDEAEVEGSITTFTSPAAFNVNGIPVDASRIVPPTGLALGVRVSVKGTVSNGTVIASEVEIEDETELESQEFEFHGAISGLDTSARQFVVRGYTVRYDGTTVLDPSGIPLADGLDVEVKARIAPAGDLLATRIEIGS